MTRPDISFAVGLLNRYMQSRPDISKLLSLADGKESFEQSDVTILHCDSRGAIAMSKNPMFHACTKHIDMKHHFIRERVAAGDLHLEYVPSQYQLADLLTKPLSELTFIKLRNQLGVSSALSLKGECRNNDEHDKQDNSYQKQSKS
ncbi:uncharacterized protein LOC112341727 [Selaginella moellendorffii]|uniref:uncharacterized protein LOC112341727 n=1 Tax=Selaginella moellendorffii TaxID=88036 RepID=UPI000D1CC670|nr:uncharacterized protein LOC112341727 [Selaginella moellendorffii]|eukprot:XP_024518095.1 uncharacterized protein LOC112341727 [Selaginella moellendorffii]